MASKIPIKHFSQSIKPLLLYLHHRLKNIEDRLLPLHENCCCNTSWTSAPQPQHLFQVIAADICEYLGWVFRANSEDDAMCHSVSVRRSHGSSFNHKENSFLTLTSFLLLGNPTICLSFTFISCSTHCPAAALLQIYLFSQCVSPVQQ